MTAEKRQYSEAMNEKMKEMEPLQNALGKLRNENNAVREKGMGLCSSEEELNNRVSMNQLNILLSDFYINAPADNLFTLIPL